MYSFSDLQHRLLILYTLKSFKLSITQGQLVEILVWQDIVDYFTLMNFLYELIDDNMVESLKIEEEEHYTLLPKGKEAIDLFNDKLPTIVKFEVDHYCELALNFLEKGVGIRTSVSAYDTNRYYANCQVLERAVPMLKFSIMVGSYEQAKKVARKFEKNAEELYNLLLEKLAENEVNIEENSDIKVEEKVDKT